MKITRQQYDEICEDSGNFYMDEFPINDADQDLMFELFNNLPPHEISLAIEWGFNDTVFRDNIFEFMCENQLNMTCEEYYKSDIARDYFDNNKLIELDFNKLKNGRTGNN